MTIDKLIEMKEQISRQIKENAQQRKLLIDLGAENTIILPLVAIANRLEDVLSELEKILREAE